MTDYALSLWRGKVALRPSLAEVAAETCAGSAFSVDDIRGPSRLRAVSDVRQAFMSAARDRTNKSLPQIGRFLHRDHTTILHGVRAHRARVS